MTDTGETPRTRARHVTDPVIHTDIHRALETLRTSDSYRVGDHAAQTIAKQPGIRVVLIALKPGGELQEHRAEWAISLQGIDGTVICTVGGETVTLTPATMLTVAAGMPHAVRGVDESALLLTIGGAHESR